MVTTIALIVDARILSAAPVNRNRRKAMMWMTYVAWTLLAILTSFVIGIIWVLLNYYVKIEITPKCLWCGREEELA